jgi:hypothetical protein
LEITDPHLRKLCDKFFFIKIKKVGPGENFDSILATILCREAQWCGVVKLETATGIYVVIFGRWVARKDLTNEVDNGIATGSKLSNDFEFGGRIFVVCDGRPLGRPDGGEAKDFTQKGNSLTDEIAGGQNILYLGGVGRASLGGGRAGRREHPPPGGREVCVHAELSGHGRVWVKILWLRWRAIRITGRGRGLLPTTREDEWGRIMGVLQHEQTRRWQRQRTGEEGEGVLGTGG